MDTDGSGRALGVAAAPPAAAAPHPCAWDGPTAAVVLRAAAADWHGLAAVEAPPAWPACVALVRAAGAKGGARGGHWGNGALRPRPAGRGLAAETPVGAPQLPPPPLRFKVEAGGELWGSRPM